MATPDPIEEPATAEPLTDTPSSEPPEETVSDDTPPDGEQEDAATLKKRLADKDRYIKKLESEKPKSAPDNRSEEIKDLEWKLENKDRIDLVKDEYDRILAEGFDGEKVSKKVALELAEKKAKIDTTSARRSRQDDITQPTHTERNVDPKGYADELDRELGITIAARKKLEEKHPHLRG